MCIAHMHLLAIINYHVLLIYISRLFKIIIYIKLKSSRAGAYSRSTQRISFQVDLESSQKTSRSRAAHEPRAFRAALPADAATAPAAD